MDTTSVCPPRLGQTATRSRVVTSDDIRRFTEMSGDRNPLHYDEVKARASRFGEIVVQGGVTRQDGVVVLEGSAVCYTMKL